MNSDYSDEVLVVVEKYIKEENIVLFDFLNKEEFQKFLQFYPDSSAFESKPSMVLIINYKLKRIREGTIYKISMVVINELREKELLRFNSSSFLIGFNLELLEDTKVFFGRSHSPSDKELFNPFDQYNAPITRNIDRKIAGIASSLNGNIKVNIRNIGQGSWNEIITNSQIKLVFDIGTLWTTSDATLLSMLGTRDLDYQNDKPIVILSHWDVDHYHFLLALSDAAIKSFTYFICRDNLPTKTASEVFDRIMRLNPTSIITIPSEIPTSGRYSKKLVGYSLESSRRLRLFNGSVHTNRNKNGMGMLIRTPSKSIIFSADLDYEQVSKYILPELNYKHEHHLIVPHHGGNAGPYKYAHSSLLHPSEAIISVGNNPYKPPHPWAINVTKLRSSRFKVIRTDTISSDYTISL